MPATIASLAERALRRLNVAVVAVADRPTFATTIPAATIATNALIELGVIDPNDAPAQYVQEQALAATKLASAHDALVAQGSVSWELAAIPQAVTEEYTKLTALLMASSFGKAADPARWPVLEARVRKVAMLMDAPAQARDAMMGVHNDLAARGLVRWSVWDIPAAVENPYIDLAAASLAPLFGQKVDPRDAAAAERSICRYIALPTSGEHVQAEYF